MLLPIHYLQPVRYVASLFPFTEEETEAPRRRVYVSRREEVRTSRKRFPEALRSRAMLSSLGGIHKGF